MIGEEGDSANEQWSAMTTLLSFVLAFMGAYSTVTLAEQHRIAGSLVPKLVPQPIYLVMMAFSLGAGCIWSMHFIGMSAIKLQDSNGNNIEINYDIIKSLLSMVACVICVYVGLYISSRDKMFCRDKEEIFQLIIEEGKKDSMDAVRSKHYLIKVALFRGTGPLLLGGIIAGGGVCIMHYIGMIAIHAAVTVHWDVGIVAASVVIAVVAATAAFWILFRVLALYPAVESLRLVCALVAALAVCGMHYTGMMAASYTLNHNPPGAVFGFIMSQKSANIVAVSFALFTSWGVSMVVQAELRAWHMYLHSRLKSSRKVLDKLHDRYDYDIILQDYETKNNKMMTDFEVCRQSHPVKVVPFQLKYNHEDSEEKDSYVERGQLKAVLEEDVERDGVSGKHEVTKSTMALTQTDSYYSKIKSDSILPMKSFTPSDHSEHEITP